MGDVFGHDLRSRTGVVLSCDGCEDPDPQSFDQWVTLAEYMIENHPPCWPAAFKARVIARIRLLSHFCRSAAMIAALDPVYRRRSPRPRGPLVAASRRFAQRVSAIFVNGSAESRRYPLAAQSAVNSIPFRSATRQTVEELQSVSRAART